MWMTPRSTMNRRRRDVRMGPSNLREIIDKMCAGFSKRVFVAWNRCLDFKKQTPEELHPPYHYDRMKNISGIIVERPLS